MWDTEEGEAGPVYGSLEQAQRILGLLIRYMNDIAATLLESPGDYEPLLMENPNDGHGSLVVEVQVVVPPMPLG